MLLINPKTTKPTEINSDFFREPNNGLLYLAAILDENDYDVDILDLEQFLHLGKKERKKIIINTSFSHKIIGITSLTNTFTHAKKIAKLIKDSYPHKIIIFGGPHVSFLYENILKKDYQNEKVIDFIIVGEAEHSLLQLVKLIEFNSIQSHEFDDLENKINKIPNIAYINSNGNCIYTGDQTKIINLESLPVPARFKLTPTNFYYTVANIIVNRGCPNQCSFCSRQQLFKSTRLRSLNSIEAEILDIRSAQTYEFINFYDNININLNFFEDFCKMLQSTHLEIPWGCELRVDNISSYHSELLKKAGCQVIATGIESASEDVLKMNFKFQDPQKVKKGLKNIKKYNIPVQAYFVLGLPGETEETFQKTIKYIQDLPLTTEDTINYFVATPYPGSRLWNEREDFGIKILEKDFSKYDCEHIIFETEDLSYNQLKRMLIEAKQIETYFNDM